MKISCVLQAAAQGRYVEMLRHQEALTSAMTPPPARRPGAYRPLLPGG